MADITYLTTHSHGCIVELAQTTEHDCRRTPWAVLAGGGRSGIAHPSWSDLSAWPPIAGSWAIDGPSVARQTHACGEVGRPTGALIRGGKGLNDAEIGSAMRSLVVARLT
jgi:hypothetical protein